MKRSAQIGRFQMVMPPHTRPQEELLSWADSLRQHHVNLSGADALNLRLHQRYAVKPAQIRQRHFECEDIHHEPQHGTPSGIFALDKMNLDGADIGERSSYFGKKAWQVFQSFYPEDTKGQVKPDHLIHVTCTGYVSPSAAQLVVAQKSWGKDTAVTHAYHMGCYASLPAIRMAEAFMQTDECAQVDVVHTEMCSLHMIPSLRDPDQILVQSLFADGHIKYSVQESTGQEPGMKILKIKEVILPDSHDSMSWQPSANGMRMTLSRDVPEKIRGNIRDFMMSLAEGRNLADLLKNAIFAVHPGGPRIIDVVREALELSEEQVATSRQVLFERGNMSSATLPHVWKEIMDSSPAKGTQVVSFAFGPGLTIFGALFEVV